MQVSEHVHALKIPFIITTGAGIVDRFVYAFLIYGPTISLIDTGVVSSQQLIFDYIRQTGREPEEIATIILTHSHPDHIGSAKSIKELTGSKILAHHGEKDWIQDIDKQFSERPVPGFYSLVGGSATVDRILEEGDKIYLGDNLDLRVLHTPGHSNGSISLYLEVDKVLISGDVIPIPGDMPIYDDPLILIESIKKLMSFKEAGVLLSSWDEPRIGDSIEEVMTDGFSYVDRLHHEVLELAKENSAVQAVNLCKLILERLNLPMFMANPLVARSLTSSLKYLQS
jgi:glyoxylase-like metal-dependent hydrolase (beta-lactamase superfamily II)